MLDIIINAFHQFDIKWSFKKEGVKRTPTRDEIYTPLRVLYDRLDEGKHAEFGQLLLKRENGKTEVYVYLGDLTDADFE